MRITFVIATLGSGGAERVMSTMANYWAEHGYDITIISLSPQSDDWYKLRPKVKRVGLDLLSDSTHIGQAIRQNARRVIRLRHELRSSQPDIVISFIDTTNVLTLIASLGLGIPVIVSERIDPRHHSIGLSWSVLRSVLYRYGDAVVVQSYAVRERASGILGSKVPHVIPNPVSLDPNGSIGVSRSHRSGHTVIAMGRLVRQKGFDLLLEAFARCAAKHCGWSLVILGEGEERQFLESLIVEWGLKDCVNLPGRVKDPTRILQGGDLFVMPSRYEGFPNVLLEAMACGLAVIATDCPSGPREIIRDGVDGVLVPPNDVEALAAAMDRLMANPAERQRLGTRAVEVVERFSIEKIMNMWDEVVAHSCPVAKR